MDQPVARKLKKFRLKNLPKGTTHLQSGILGEVYISLMTDEQAEILYQNGKSQYVEKIIAVEPKRKRKGTTVVPYRDEIK